MHVMHEIPFMWNFDEAPPLWVETPQLTFAEMAEREKIKKEEQVALEEFKLEAKERAEKRRRQEEDDEPPDYVS